MRVAESSGVGGAHTLQELRGRQEFLGRDPKILAVRASSALADADAMDLALRETTAQHIRCA